MSEGVTRQLLIATLLSFTGVAHSTIMTSGQVSVNDFDFTPFPLAIGPGDTDLGSGLLVFLNSRDASGASLTVDGGSTLSAGALVAARSQITTSAPAPVINVDGAGSQIRLTRAGPLGRGSVDLASTGPTLLNISNGGAVIHEDVTGTCADFECRVGQIGNAAGSSAVVNVSGAGSLLDLALDTTQIIVFGQAPVIEDPVFETGAFGTVGGQTNVSVNVTGGARMETGYALVGAAGASNGNTGTESISSIVTVDGAGSTWDSDFIDIAFTSGDPLAPAVEGAVIVSNGGVIDSTMIVRDGGILGGNGTVIGDIFNLGGTIGPGLSPGTLTVDGDFLMESGTLTIEVASLESGQFDIIESSGIIEILGGEILFDFIGDYVPSASDFFQFLIADSTTIADAVTFRTRGLAGGFDFDIGSGIFTALNDARAVSEPSALLLLGAGLALLARVRSRRRAVARG